MMQRAQRAQRIRLGDRRCRELLLPRLLAAAAAMLVCSPLAPGQSSLDAARDYHAKHGARILREYAELLAIPNVAADKVNINKNAAYIAEQFRRRGAKVQTLRIDGAPPILIGFIKTLGATRTVGVYAHYDGQPVDESKWMSPPWSPTLLTAAIEDGGERRAMPRDGERIDPEWRLYARSAGDDKASIMALLAALDALHEAGVPLTSNVVVLLEGEEEAGSPHLEAYFKRYADLLRADVWLICDGPVHPSRRPQLVFGVRGIAELELTVYGPERAMHSGHYGNWAPNPGLALSQLLASMKNDAGRVLIEGFYDTVEPLTSAERAAIESVPDVDDAIREQFGLAATEADNAPLIERLLLPSLNIRGLRSATVGEQARNIVPTEATASIDIRLVKGEDPQRMLDRVEAHIRQHGYTIVRETPDHATRLAHAKIALVERGVGYRAMRAPMDAPIVRTMIEAANLAAGEPVILTPSLGGSGPLYLFEEMLGAPLVLVPIANHDDNQHAPNENLRIANLWWGIDLLSSMLTASADEPGEIHSGR